MTYEDRQLDAVDLMVQVMAEFGEDIDSMHEQFLWGKKIGMRLMLMILHPDPRDRRNASFSLISSSGEWRLTEKEYDAIEKWEGG